MKFLMILSEEPMVRVFGWSLLHFVWEAAVVAGLTAVVLKLLNGRSALVRYGVACGALALTAVLPLATFGYLAMTANGLPSSITEFGGRSIPITELARGFDSTGSWQGEMVDALDRALPWLLTAWCVGVAVFLIRLNVGLVIARRMKYLAIEAMPAELQQGFAEVKVWMGIARPVKLLQSAMVQVPTVIGWLRPVVLIPVECITGMSPTQIEAIFAHELAHIRRHDYLVNVLQSLVEAMLFYHPAVWWVSKQVRKERENCCDDLAVGVSGDSLAYAKALSLLEEQRSSYPAISLGANGGALVMRIRRLLGYKETPAVSQMAGVTLLAVMVMGIALSVGALAHGQSSAEKKLAAERAAGPRPVMSGVYQKWLDEDVVWIITPEERAKFLKTSNDDERNEFIKQFWERRNEEVSGGAQDAFRKEYYRRIAYANVHFAATVPGWKNDRGRIYITNGRPDSIDSHPSGGDGGLKPWDVWHYDSVEGHSAPVQGKTGESTTTFTKGPLDMKFVDTCNCGNYQLQASPKMMR